MIDVEKLDNYSPFAEGHGQGFSGEWKVKKKKIRKFYSLHWCHHWLASSYIDTFAHHWRFKWIDLHSFSPSFIFALILSLFCNGTIICKQHNFVLYFHRLVPLFYAIYFYSWPSIAFSWAALLITYAFMQICLFQCVPLQMNFHHSFLAHSFAFIHSNIASSICSLSVGCFIFATKFSPGKVKNKIGIQQRLLCANRY